MAQPVNHPARRAILPALLLGAGLALAGTPVGPGAAAAAVHHRALRHPVRHEAIRHEPVQRESVGRALRPGQLTGAGPVSSLNSGPGTEPYSIQGQIEQGCEVLCSRDTNPCDPISFKRADGRCSTGTY